MTTVVTHKLIQLKYLTVNDIVEDISANIGDLEKAILDDNFSIKDEIGSKDKDKEIEFRKGQFKHEQLANIHYFYLFLIFVYIVCLLGCLYKMFINKTIFYAKKVVIFGVLCIIPIISTRLITFVLFFLSTFFEKLPKNVNFEL